MTRRLRAVLAALGLALAVAAAVPTAAAQDDYDPKRAGNPVRVAAYILHPVGVVLDYVIFRPAYWLGSHEPLRTLFGRTEDD